MQISHLSDIYHINRIMRLLAINRNRGLLRSSTGVEIRGQV
jgi:hypothetical protein